MSTSIRIDDIKENMDYRGVLDAEWNFVVTMIDDETQEELEKREITIHKLACGFNQPHLEDVIEAVKKCRTFDEVVEVGSNKPTNSAYNKYKAQKVLWKKSKEASLEGIQNEMSIIAQEKEKSEKNKEEKSSI